MRGRPITAEEFERILEVVPKVRPRDTAAWRHYLEGLWLSGLRLAESLVMSWEEDASISIDLSGRRPPAADLRRGRERSPGPPAANDTGFRSVPSHVA